MKVAKILVKAPVDAPAEVWSPVALCTGLVGGRGSFESAGSHGSAVAWRSSEEYGKDAGTEGRSS